MFIGHFDGQELNKRVWIETYLPQWSSRAKHAQVTVSRIVFWHCLFQIKKPWSEEYNGEIRVSNLQTGTFSGPVG